MNKTLFIIVCILALITVIIYTFVASAIHRKELCQKSPYYFCDTDWYCCKKDAVNGCASNMNSSNSFKISDQFYNTSSSNPSGQTPLKCADPNITANLTYHDACIKPVQEYVKYKQPNENVALDCIYVNTPCPLALTTILNRSPTPITITPGQCCYKQIDYPTSTNGQIANTQNIYPTNLGVGTWGSPTNGNYGTYYSSNPNFVFPQGSSGADTRLNSCKNSLFGTAGTYTTAQPYSGC